MLKCGIKELDITPSLGMDMPGHFARRKSEGIFENLFATAVYFENENEKVILVSCDTIFLPTDLCTSVKIAIADLLETKPQNILLCATHTHTGGPVHTWGDIVKEDEFYLRFLASRIVDAAVLAQKDAVDVTIGFNIGKDYELAHYRDFIGPDGTFSTGKALGSDKKAFGDIDPDVSVLRINNKEDNSVYGMIVNYTCHCDCVRAATSYSADYPGIMRDTLCKVYGEKFHPVFINGFCGNINHVMYETFTYRRFPEYYKIMGKRLAGEAMRTFENTYEFTDEVILGGMQESVSLCTRLPREDELEFAAECEEKVRNGEELSIMNDFYMNEYRRIQKEGIDVKELPVQAIRIGDLTVYGMPGEIYVEFGFMLKEKSPSKHTICANLSNGNFGYIPIIELFRPGIYEARVCASSFMCCDAGYLMTDKALELGEKLKYLS